MSQSPLRLIIFSRDESPRVQEVRAKIRDFLTQQPATNIVAEALADEDNLEGLDADLVITLGGDGAILRACRQLGRQQLPILGINLGRFGFLADLSPDEFFSDFEAIRTRRYTVVEHLMFESIHRHADGTSETLLGLNEVAVLSGASLQMVDITLAIDGENVATYSGDGLIVSTPVGSTAHSLSAGGPILRQDLKAFVITPICPHALTNRPLVDRAECVFTLGLPRVPEGMHVVIDGQIKRPVLAGDVIEVRKAPVTFKLAKLPGHSYYATLHRKLGWGGQPRYRRM